MYFALFDLQQVEGIIKPMHLGPYRSNTFEVLCCVFVADDEVCDLCLLEHD